MLHVIGTDFMFYNPGLDINQMCKDIVNLRKT